MKLNNKGFSLVELMVVVAIIGILASVAIPSVNKYMAKARQGEAKTNLGSLYTAQKSFFSEYNVYDSRFGVVGFGVEGKLRYNIGFGAAGVQAGPANGYTAPAPANVSFAAIAGGAAGYCDVDGAFGAGLNCSVVRDATNTLPADITAASVTANNTFVAEALSIISASAGQADIWQITEQKRLDNTQNGID